MLTIGTCRLVRVKSLMIGRIVKSQWWLELWFEKMTPNSSVSISKLILLNWYLNLNWILNPWNGTIDTWKLLFRYWFFDISQLNSRYLKFRHAFWDIDVGSNSTFQREFIELLLLIQRGKVNRIFTVSVHIELCWCVRCGVVESHWFASHVATFRSLPLSRFIKNWDQITNIKTWQL